MFQFRPVLSTIAVLIFSLSADASHPPIRLRDRFPNNEFAQKMDEQIRDTIRNGRIALIEDKEVFRDLIKTLQKSLSSYAILIVVGGEYSVLSQLHFFLKKFLHDSIGLNKREPAQDFLNRIEGEPIFLALKRVKGKAPSIQDFEIAYQITSAFQAHPQRGILLYSQILLDELSQEMVLHEGKPLLFCSSVLADSSL